MVESGAMRRVITLQSPTVTRGTLGQNVVEWTNEKTGVRAGRERLSGGEQDVARRIVATATHRYTIWFDSALDLDTTWRIVDEEKIFNIGAIDTDGDSPKQWVIDVTQEL